MSNKSRPQAPSEYLQAHTSTPEPSNTGATPRVEIEHQISSNQAQQIPACATSNDTNNVPINNTDQTADSTNTSSFVYANTSTSDNQGSDAGAPFEPPVQNQNIPQQNSPIETHTIVKSRTRKLPIFVAGFLGTVAGALLVIVLLMAGVFNVEDDGAAAGISIAPANSSPVINVEDEDPSLAEAVAVKTLPSVISISASLPDAYSEGTGVVIDNEGNIVTNYHVIADAEDIVVTMDGTDFEATLVGSDPSSDLAVINIDCDASQLTPIEIGDSDALNVGEWVMALGNPFGNEQSVSSGIVSSLNRSSALKDESGLAIYVNLIQTDAAINPGNSGGALVNKNGELVGINSIIESYSGSSSGVGFAIPSNYAMEIANQIIDGETPVHPYLGVTVSSVSPFSAEVLGVEQTYGAIIRDVAKDGPAAEAGLKKDDIVVAIDGEPIDTADALIINIRGHKIGDSIKLTVLRDDEELELEATLTTDEALLESVEEQAEPNASDSVDPMSEEDILDYLEWFLND